MWQTWLRRWLGMRSPAGRQSEMDVPVDHDAAPARPGPHAGLGQGQDAGAAGETGAERRARRS